MYEYRILNVARVIDGDTYDLDLDLGFYATLRVRVRCIGIDTWEVYGKNADPRGIAARDFAAEWFHGAFELGHVRVRTRRLDPASPVGDGSFGRWAGTVYDDTGELLSDALRDNGHSKTSS